MIKYKNKFCMMILTIALIFSAINIQYSYAGDNKLPKGYHIIINCKTNKLGYFKDGKFIKEFKVATGKKSTPTPKGKFKIVNKIKNRPYYSGGIPGGDPRNPLGDRWLGLKVGSTYGTTYGIHGNNNESSIGKYVSGGCIRMHNKDVRWLYDQISVGATVIIYNSSDSFIDAAKKYGVTLSDKNADNKPPVKNPNIKGHWAEINIRNAMEKGWVAKTEAFRPEDSITRAEFVTIVNNAFGFSKKAELTFKDVSSKGWYYEHIKIAVGEGYINGYEDNTFKPNGYITREEAASIITSIKNNKDSMLDKLSMYKDANKVSKWAKSSVEGAIEAGYMGVGGTLFNPKSNITRAETVVTIERVKK